MKLKIFNEDKLKEEDIHDKVIRAKAIILNSDKEILLGEAFGTVQFPGGHLKEKEELKEGLKRELLEETGLIIDKIDEPFFGLKHYVKDYPIKGNNRSIEIYYFFIETDEKFNLDNIRLDEQEKNGNFKLYYIPLKKFKRYIKMKEKDNPINRVINKEMMLALKYLGKKWRK